MAKRALLVNDSKFESMILKDMLQKLDYSVEIADEYEALYAIDKFKPNIVIVNYIMERTRGDQLIKLMKVGVPKLKCILSTSSNVKRSDFKGNNIDGLLHTPISQFLLESIIQDIEQSQKIKAKSTLCSHCKKDLVTFEGITFCPFCGTSVNK